MKNITRFLSVVLCCVPAFSAVAAGPVATTSGSNLTSFNPNNAHNNQWATMTNGRYDSGTSAKVDFGNCNAVVLRCAQPKCANGGCADSSVASAIVAGCVQSNDSCKQYGNDLVSYMTAQLVANSNAKINQQNAALEQAKIQADAQAAAAAAANQQSQQQMQMMQEQMSQMQQQMQRQQAESAAALQEALAAQQAQSQQALNDMKSAATAAAQQNEAGVSAYQQDAINRGVSTDVLERQKIGGQVMTELENAQVHLKTAKEVMEHAFEYAGCDRRGNNCTGPKRVKKWREISQEFFEPYDEAVDKLYDALIVAQNAGVDMSQIYMMLNDSCNSWGQYMCPKNDDGGQIVYADTTGGKKGTPYVCPVLYDSSGDDLEYSYASCSRQCNKDYDEDSDRQRCYRDTCLSPYCQPCTLLKTLTDQNEVYTGWVEAEGNTQNGNTTVVACASGALDSSTLFARRTKNKNGAGMVNINDLQNWIDQVEPSTQYSYANKKPTNYCHTSDDENLRAVLEASVLSKTVPAKNKKLCVANIGDTNTYDETCPYISPIYAICDTHSYNAGHESLVAENGRTLYPDELKNYYENRCGVTGDCGNCKGSSDNMDNCKQLSCADSRGCYTSFALFEAANKNKTFSGVSPSTIAEIKEIVGLKVTAFSQQMYKQYEYLSATIRRFQIQLEKAVLTATLEAAGGKSEGGSSSGGLAGANGNDDKTIHLAGANNCSNFMDFDSAYNCLQTNISVIKSNISSNSTKACLQLQETVASANSILSDANKKKYYDSSNSTNPGACKDYMATGKQCHNRDKDSLTACANALNNAVMAEKRDQAQQSRAYQRIYPL